MGSLLYANDIATVNQAKIDAARITQASSNARKGAETALANFDQSLANKRRMDAAGTQITDNSVTAGRVQDAYVANDLNAQLAFAKAQGQAAATSAAAGVGGSSVDTYNRTLALQFGIGERQRADDYHAQEQGLADQRGAAIKDAVGGLSNNVYRANLDYTQYVDWKKPSVFEQVLSVGTTVAAAVYGGPKAAEATMSFWEGRQAARNNDYAQASRSFNETISAGYDAAKDYAQTHPSRSTASNTSSASSNSSQAPVFSFTPPDLTYDSVMLK